MSQSGLLPGPTDGEKVLGPCAKRGSKRLLKAVEDILGELAMLPFDVPADAEYGGIRAELEAGGRLIGSSDLLIAARACASGATLVTANTDEFNRVCGLRDRLLT